MDLRPYQAAARDAVLSEWEGGRRRTLLVLPTGTGKTIVFSAVIAACVAKGQRVLVLAHRGELLEQAADKLQRTTGIASAVEKAEDTAVGSFFRVTVGSVQTLMHPQRLERFPPDFFGAVVIDEAHHCLADSYQRVLAHFSRANVLGVTASLAYEYTLPKAIRDGWLSPIRALTIPLKLDISQVGVAAGDYKAGELGSALDPYLGQIATEMMTACAGRKTVVFLPLVATSQKFRDMLQARGFRAAEVNGASADRAQVIRDFADGKYDVLCNSMLLTEGWDCPAVDCIVVLRPTKSRALYCQMVGRGTRIAPGKDHLLLLDFLWHTSRHELCRPAALICESEDVARKMTENLESAGDAEDLEAAEAKAAQDVVAEREAALAKQLEEMRRRKKRLVDPLQFEMSIAAEDLSGYVPSFGWEMAPPTARQLDALERMGLDPGEVENAGKASKLLDRLGARRAEGLTTPKQIRFLEDKGFVHVGSWPFEAARRMIDRIAANHWRVPYGVDPRTYRPDPEVT
jgi:superfamily II DNA or RNA helicase